jgi:uncharacterized protein YjbI with pentapeptide repeats
MWKTPVGHKKRGFKQEPASQDSLWWQRLRGWTGFGEKKLWDWLQLLGTLSIPVVVAVATALFSSQQSRTQNEIAELNTEHEALQAYLDQMGALLLDKNLRNPEEAAGAEVRTLARTRTLSVLGRLNPGHKSQVMRFLVEAGLVQSVDGKDPVIGLMGANLESTNLTSANLRGADLTQANLRGATLSDAKLTGAKGVTKERLEAQATALGGATMPDGKKLPPETAPLEPGPIPAGEYVANQFKPAFRVAVGKGWALSPKRENQVLFIGTRSAGGQLNFTNPLHVFDRLPSVDPIWFLPSKTSRSGRPGSSRTSTWKPRNRFQCV